MAGAVSAAGGLGLIGGAYGDRAWIEQAFAEAGSQTVGCGLITWALPQHPDILNSVLARQPKAMMLSFGDPSPYVAQISAAQVPLILQVQTLRDAKHAADLGAQVIVAQGGEAGGHGQARGTMNFVPEVADMLARDHPEVILVAAGGIADGRGLAAALMLGAEGVLVGSRFWASDEALVAPDMLAAALQAGGDDTIRSRVMDVARRLNWPDRFTCRVLRNAFTERWHNDLSGLIASVETEARAWSKAWAGGDPQGANTFVGEAVGLIDRVQPAGEIVTTMAAEAESLLGGAWRKG